MNMKEAHRPHSLATLGIHADDALNLLSDVAPPLHMSTNFRFPRSPTAVDLQSATKVTETGFRGKPHVYTRYSGPNTSRLETILNSFMKAEVLSYSSGLAAFNALLCLLCPKVLAIGHGYHGCLGVSKLHQKMRGMQEVELLDPFAWDDAGLGPGDLVHLETPLNPFGTALNIAKYAKMAHDRGAFLSVDSTFAPPGLQDPFLWGADIVMHSGSKYIGGHSDLLCGVLAVQDSDLAAQLYQERAYLGSVMGNMESWLGVRSMRTFDLRVRTQSVNASRLSKWMYDCLQDSRDGIGAEAVRAVVKDVKHASLQFADFGWLKDQMPNGFGPVFAILMKTEDLARRLPDSVLLFQHATSLGGIESLIEWRKKSDCSVDPTLIRISVGGENWEDLRDDLLRGFEVLGASDGAAGF